jgi:hypothetical protein
MSGMSRVNISKQHTCNEVDLYDSLLDFELLPRPFAWSWLGSGGRYGSR